MPAWLPYVSPIPIYSATGLIASTVDGKAFFEIKGSNTKKVTIRKIIIATSAAACVVVKRHTAFVITTTPTAVTPVTLNSLNTTTITLTAQLKTTAVEAAAGTTLFHMRNIGGLPTILDFNHSYDNSLTLNGTSETLNFSCAEAVAADVTILFTEE